MAAITAVTNPALKKHTASLIFVHGLGDSGLGLSGIAQNWRSQNKYEEVNIIFPNAPSIPITLNDGMRMPAWHDLVSLEEVEKNEDYAGVLRSRDSLRSLIKAEIEKGIPAERVVIGGFSQGAALSLVTGLTHSSKLAGIFSLSGYMPVPDHFKKWLDESENKNLTTSVFAAHGDADAMVMLDWGKASFDQLKKWGYNIAFNVYKNVGHSISPDILTDLEKYLDKVIPPIAE